MSIRMIAGVVMSFTVTAGSVAWAQGEEFSTGVVEANGLTFHYLEAGEGPIVLALHGFPDPRIMHGHIGIN